MIIYTHNISIFKHDWNDDPQQQTYPAGWVETSTDTNDQSAPGWTREIDLDSSPAPGGLKGRVNGL